jgi:transposase
MLNCTAKRLAELRPNTLLVGIDIGKRQHACIVMDLGANVLTRLKFSNSRWGFERLLEKLEATRKEIEADHLLFGMEPTGHYWRNLAYFLEGQGHRFHLVNPFTLKRHREGQDLSRTKNDYRDAAMVAELLRTGKFTLTQLTYGWRSELRRTFVLHTRLRDDRARQKNLLRGVLDCLFPEFTQVFKDPLGLTARAVLLVCPAPDEIRERSLEEFMSLVREAHRGRKLKLQKLGELHRLAQESIGVTAENRALALELKVILQTVELLDDQIEEVEAQLIEQFLASEESKYLLSIKGIGPITGAGILAEIGDISTYQNAKALTKLGGINPSQSDSGTHRGTHTPMTKKGRARLRRVVFQAALSCIAHNPAFQADYRRLRERKHNPLPKMKAVGAMMNKLLRVVYALLKERRTFEQEHQWQVKPLPGVRVATLVA